MVILSKRQPETVYKIIMKGWVYIISNKAMIGLVKVGYSDRDPKNRASELNSTASPHPHKVEFAVLVDKPREVEKSVHRKLKDKHEGKEWFRCSVDIAKSAILSDQTNPVITHGSITLATKQTVPSNPKLKNVQAPATDKSFVNPPSELPTCHLCHALIRTQRDVLSISDNQVCKKCFNSSSEYDGFFSRLFR